MHASHICVYIREAYMNSDSCHSNTSIPLFSNEGNAVLSDSQLIRTIMNNSQYTIYFKDVHSRFILNSKAHALQFGLSDPSDLKGKSDLDYYPEPFVRKSIQDEQEIMRTGLPLIGIVEKWDRDNGSS